LRARIPSFQCFAAPFAVHPASFGERPFAGARGASRAERSRRQSDHRQERAERDKLSEITNGPKRNLGHHGLLIMVSLRYVLFMFLSNGRMAGLPN
jgi:hypothetical protein